MSPFPSTHSTLNNATDPIFGTEVGVTQISSMHVTSSSMSRLAVPQTPRPIQVDTSRTAEATVHHVVVTMYSKLGVAVLRAGLYSTSTDINGVPGPLHWIFLIHSLSLSLSLSAGMSASRPSCLDPGRCELPNRHSNRLMQGPAFASTMSLVVGASSLIYQEDITRCNFAMRLI